MTILSNDYRHFILNETPLDITDELKAFVATAQTGSFTSAAAQLGVSNRLTSKYVAGLEARLEVRLLQRTTRKVGLTPAGEDLLARAPILLDELDDLLAEVSESARGHTGVIRISAPVTFGEFYLCRMLGRFAQLHPGLTLDLRLNDRQADLASEGIDLAFRIGRSEMLSLKQRKLGGLRSVLVASPEYLRAFRTPESPADLDQHDCIIDTNRQLSHRWLFQKGASQFTVMVRGRFLVNSARAAAELATAGLGIAYAPQFAVSDGLDAGTLVEIMPEYTQETVPVNAVYLEGRALPRKVRALIDFAIEDIKTAAVL